VGGVGGGCAAGAEPPGLPGLFARGAAPVTEFPVIVCRGGREEPAPASRTTTPAAAAASASSVTVQRLHRFALPRAPRPLSGPEATGPDGALAVTTPVPAGPWVLRLRMAAASRST